ncbi:NosD domain-containing protein [Caminibacter mediatlanticus]|uniref:Carbohydrate binding and sugar hydrolysis n=1 Tax=Caminibacter mediatlanticus TB-2 TaxID=391592 RepID=A0AAI9AJG2_9BACT|nr:NosD domain-containing protein [Caminibacter mediatlanticus]EDM24594.1 Carbohydrate binding and sugar hydrolysis [Caminibacter mediatlanticus TB-2]
MIKKLYLIFFFSFQLFAFECYSILTETGFFTPVYPYNFKDYYNFLEPRCNILQDKIIWESNLSYIGCYRKYEDANKTLHTLKFNFKNPKIVKHKFSFKDQYVIFPRPSTVNKININNLIKDYKPEKLLKKFPKNFYGNGIDLVPIEKLPLMPTINIYEFYRYYKKHNLSTKILVLYNGIYNIEYLYKKINNKKIIEKFSNNTYIIKYPIYISPTASLVIKNKTILLETKPKPIFIMYHGKIYAYNSKFITWDIKKNIFAKREFIPENELLLIGKQTPRPYFLGFSSSKTYFINNEFRGLGFHSTTATFGISIVNYPSDLIINQYSLFTYLNKKGKPNGYYIGNLMYKNMMGFYCANAGKSAIIGNVMYDNLIYNIDPHDYSKHLIIIRNLTAKAKHAHGIVISRGVDNTIIAQNFSFNNHSAGIMLDRSSSKNYIYDNLTALNGYMGISIQESDNNLIENNKIIANLIDGIIIRNSLRNTIKNNLITYNLKNGIEVLTKNIDFMIYRDFLRDPYHKATSAYIIKNKIYNNMFFNITNKNNAAIYLKDNYLKSKYYPNYGGELNIFIPKIIENKGHFTLYGIGNPYLPLSSDFIKMSTNALKTAIKIYIEASCNNDFISDLLAKIYIKRLKNNRLGEMEYIRGISLLYPNDMYSYGYFLLSQAKTKKDKINALSYIIQSIIFGKENALIDIKLIKYITNINKDDINNAFEITINRLSQGKLIDNSKYNVMCKLTSHKKAIIESKLKQFLFRVKKSKVKDFYELSNVYYKNFNLFTNEVIKKINHIFYKGNIGKIKYMKLLKKRNKIINNNIECKKVFNKLQKTKKSLVTYYKSNKKEFEKLLSQYIDRYINLINEFRINKIDKKLIYKLMEQ